MIGLQCRVLLILYLIGEFFCQVSLTGKDNFYEQKGFGTLTLDKYNEGFDPDINISVLSTMVQIEGPSW